MESSSKVVFTRLWLHDGKHTGNAKHGEAVFSIAIPLELYPKHSEVNNQSKGIRARDVTIFFQGLLRS